MTEQPTDQRNIEVARLRYLVSIERLMADAEQAKRDRDRLLQLIETDRQRSETPAR